MKANSAMSNSTKHICAIALTAIASFLLAATIAIQPARAAVLGIGKPAPDFTLTDVTGKQYTLSRYRGKTVVLEWVDPECSFSNGKHYESGNIPSMQKEYRANGVIWLSINSAAPGMQGDLGGDELKAWQKKIDWSGTAYFRDQDGKVGRMYRATATPDMYVIDPSGNLVYAGAIDSISSNDIADIPKAINYVKQALAEVAAGKPVSKSVTRPYGCVIKYAGGHA
jgi:glutathione peroxidase-family protein